MMFLIMVRITDPLLPRAVWRAQHGAVFPSGAVYPQQGFPRWMQCIAAADPFTHAGTRSERLLKNTGFEAIELTRLSRFSVVMMGAATMLFKRSL